jgi:hypothetical protein
VACICRFGCNSRSGRYRPAHYLRHVYAYQGNFSPSKARKRQLMEELVATNEGGQSYQPPQGFRLCLEPPICVQPRSTASRDRAKGLKLGQNSQFWRHNRQRYVGVLVWGVSPLSPFPTGFSEPQNRCFGAGQIETKKPAAQRRSAEPRSWSGRVGGDAFVPVLS